MAKFLAKQSKAKNPTLSRSKAIAYNCEFAKGSLGNIESSYNLTKVKDKGQDNVFCHEKKVSTQKFQQKQFGQGFFYLQRWQKRFKFVTLKFGTILPILAWVFGMSGSGCSLSWTPIFFFCFVIAFKTNFKLIQFHLGFKKKAYLPILHCI